MEISPDYLGTRILYADYWATKNQDQIAIFDEMVANNFFVGGHSKRWSSSISSSQSIKLGALELLAGVLHIFDVF